MSKLKKSEVDQLEIKKAILTEFSAVEQRVSKSWLDVVDCDPDPNDPEHWDYLLKLQDKCYINLKFFPTITIEPLHTDSYVLGRIKYKDNMSVNDITAYLHNILDDYE